VGIKKGTKLKVDPRLVQARGRYGAAVGKYGEDSPEARQALKKLREIQEDRLLDRLTTFRAAAKAEEQTS
jgi:hypothetical protein